MNRNKTIVGVLLLLAMLCSPAMADVYNFLEDWSGEGTQPDGQWYYRGGTKSNIAYKTPTWSGTNWQIDNSFAQAIGATYIRANGYNWMSLRWLAPEDGVVTLDMAGMIVDSSGYKDMQWQVLLQDVVLDEGTWTVGSEATLNIPDISVSAGDYVTLSVNSSVVGNHSRINFSTMQVVPEPTTLGLLGVGGLLGVLRRRKR